MTFSVQDLLDLPLLVSARPEVLVGHDLDRRVVRWIHTSEIYEISALLKGGEVLFTTGLGLVGMSAEAMSRYVQALAHQGVAALVLELGRTFTLAPSELRGVATEHGLPLILLHGVVPFIEITETVHPILIAGELGQLRRAEKASAELNEALLAGRSLPELMLAVGRVCAAPAGLYSLEHELLAGEDVDQHHDGQAPADLVRTEVGNEPWAVLCVGLSECAGARQLAGLCATAIGISFSQATRASTTWTTAGGELLADIATGRYLSSAQITSRAGAAGFTVRSGTHVVGLSLDMTTLTPVRSGLTATTEAARHIFGPTLVTEVSGEVLVAAAIRPGNARSQLAAFADAIDAELRATVGGSVVRLTAGPLVRDVAELARSVPRAREAAQLARKLRLGSRVVLASVVADAALERFIVDQLGPILEQDARRASDLMLTMDAYLEAGLSKTAAAAALGIRRQTLYARLERISQLLGGLDLEDRQRRTALDLALVSWRMRSSAASHRSRADPHSSTA